MHIGIQWYPLRSLLGHPHVHFPKKVLFNIDIINGPPISPPQIAGNGLKFRKVSLVKSTQESTIAYSCSPSVESLYFQEFIHCPICLGFDCSWWLFFSLLEKVLHSRAEEGMSMPWFDFQELTTNRLFCSPQHLVFLTGLLLRLTKAFPNAWSDPESGAFEISDSCLSLCNCVHTPHLYAGCIRQPVMDPDGSAILRRLTVFSTFRGGMYKYGSFLFEIFFLQGLPEASSHDDGLSGASEPAALRGLCFGCPHNKFIKPFRCPSWFNFYRTDHWRSSEIFRYSICSTSVSYRLYSLLFSFFCVCR